MFRRETQRVEADLREWKARDATVAASALAIQDSGRLLAGMETQTRAGLDQEIKRTRDQRGQMEGTVMGAKLQARQVEERMMGIEEFAQVKELEKTVSRGRHELEEKRRQRGRAGSRGALLRNDGNQWDLFKKVVLDTAKAWKGKELATKAVKEEGEALNELTRRVAMMREAAEAARQEQVWRRTEQDEMRRRTEQDEMRRRTEQEGWARLDKVSSEVGRMEKVLGCRTINQGGDIVGERGATETSCVERSFGEGNVKESTRGGIQRKEGSTLLEPTVGSDCSQVQLGDMGASEHGFFSS